VFTTHNKMLEDQIAQQVSSSSIPPASFLCKPEPNPREQCNAMIVRGVRQLKGPKGISNDESLHAKHNDNVEIVKKQVPITFTDSHKDDVVKDTNVAPKDSKQTCPKPSTPPLPFP